MRRFVISILLIIGAVINANAATPVARGRGSTASTPTAQTADATARSAVRTTAARSATPARGTAARSATTPTKTVSARAATGTQKVINSGTKVSGAVANTAVNEECQNKYYGCMDAFCMLDNTSGGRCLCSNRNAELDTVLAEIEKLDQQSYQMATYGVEKIEMGSDADAVIAAANAAAAAASGNVPDSASNRRRTLDLSAWDNTLVFDDDLDVFGSDSPIDGKTGDSLHQAASDLCFAQIPECSAESSVLKLLYAQKIKSDCNAYENSLKQQKSASQTKLSTAERALRDAALEQFQSANKYDLGQCTLEFKKCMQTKAECGDDFASCASVSAFDSTNVRQSTSKKVKNYAIQGSVTTIEIAASTYDTLLAKKPICDTVTKQCARVADQVWDTFLRDVAPQIKSAELIAEDNARQSCIGNISSCFQKACKDNIDPNDPDGSYDMCLTRPETMLNLCRVPLNACGIDTSSASKAQKSQIWDFVVARLASMRVDSCTNAVKSCLQSDDRCGKDYTQCIGLDMDSVIALCPTDKLVGCQENGTKKSLSEISDLVMGIFLNLDDAMLNQCQNAVTEKMIEICGDTATCAAFDTDNAMGTESLLSYKDGEGNYVIDGLVSFGNVKISKVDDVQDPEDVRFGEYELNISDYKNHLDDDNVTVQRVVSALQSAANKINQKIAILSQDTIINMCVNGRDMSQIRGAGPRTQSVARYPHLLDSSILAIINGGLERANQNYTKKYNQLVSEALKAQNSEIKSVLCAAMASSNKPVCVEYGTLDENDSVPVCVKYENTFSNVFTAAEDSGMSGNGYETKYVISGANMARLTQAQQSGHSEYVQTDTYGNMLGRISMSAVFSPSSNICTLTTESVICKEAEAVITTSTKNSSGGYRFMGLKIGGDSATKIQEYHGAMCKEFGEPVVTTNTVEM